jgi:asparagine synthase (glutamine-hydrolysing)
MISDVPVGAFLSGGIDSSAASALMKKYHSGQLHTFSIGFQQDSYNELPDADRAAEYIKTHHHSKVINPDDPITYINNAIAAYDQLFADNSLIPMVEVSKLAREFVTVVLSGDGADELFAGYITYNADKMYHTAQLMPRFIRKFIAKPRKIASKKRIGLQFKAQQFFYGTLFDYQTAHYLWKVIFHPEDRIKILGEQYKDLVYDTDPSRTFKKYYSKVEHLEKLDQHLYVDGMTWLTDDILVKVDRSTMHTSLEARAPFLDKNLVEFAASIPPELKLNGREKKYILKFALRELLPVFVLNKKKSGFNAPVNFWLPGDEANEFRKFNKYVFYSKTG